jgi:hypothetical protein
MYNLAANAPVPGANGWRGLVQMSAQTLCGGMPSLTQIAEVFGTQPVGTTRDLGSLGEYLSVGLLDESG